MKNKISFITELLNSNKIEASQKERLLQLTANELKKNEERDEIILFEIEAIKRQLAGVIVKSDDLVNSASANISVTNSEEQKNELPEYIDPKNLKSFLLEYNKNRILKYTCHEIDDLDSFLLNFESKEFCLNKYTELIELEYKKISSKYYGKISDNIKGLFWAYLKGGKPWSIDNIKYSWNSESLKKWCTNNPNFVPNPGLNLRRAMRYDGFEFESILSKYTNKRIASFSDLVIHFKHLFHIRNDNSLKEIIERKNQIEDYNALIDFNLNLPENIEFFTDVDKIIQIYKKIIEMMLEFVDNNNKERPIVNLSLFESNNQIIFSIHHENSIFGKTISNCLNRPGEKETDLIGKLINGVCQLNLKADFGGNFAEINLWNGLPRKEIKLTEFKGVEFQLIF